MWFSSPFYIASQAPKKPCKPHFPTAGCFWEHRPPWAPARYVRGFFQQLFSPFWARLKQRVSNTKCILMAGEEWDEVVPDLPKISKNGKPRVLTLCTSSRISRKKWTKCHSPKRFSSEQKASKKANNSWIFIPHDNAKIKLEIGSFWGRFLVFVQSLPWGNSEEIQLWKIWREHLWAFNVNLGNSDLWLNRYRYCRHIYACTSCLVILAF